ncbi:importin-5-like protein [Tanacetum coccineum]|uniref:Importin-5-like protein n=1 Tax=Tanacetum coccineum TaxID=301880 RepID=A0ABQ5IWE1_9ASTR
MFNVLVAGSVSREWKIKRIRLASNRLVMHGLLVGERHLENRSKGLLSLIGGQEATAQEALELLIGLAGTELRFFRRQLMEVVRSMLQIAEADILEAGTDM